MGTKVLILRTHQAIWSKKRGYGLTQDGGVVEFVAPSSANPTMYFGRLMDNTKMALDSGQCFGTEISDAQTVRSVATPLSGTEADRLFETAIWSDGTEPIRTLTADDRSLIVKATRSF